MNIKRRFESFIAFAIPLLLLSTVLAKPAATEALSATDPGVQPNAGPAPDPARICPSKDSPMAIDGLTPDQMSLFCAGADEFAQEDKVVEDGLGPTFNLTSCIGCHLHPTMGGSSPPGHNPQFEFVQNNSKDGFNKLPWFITKDGPVRVARFVKDLDPKKWNPDKKWNPKKKETEPNDGGVHALFTISGLKDAEGCMLHQPDFEAQRKLDNVIFRIPTPTFGGGLIEAIEDKTIHDNLERNHKEYGMKSKYGVPKGRANIVRIGHTTGTENRNGNDGTIARFGWKAQNKSLLVFAGEAYNVEMGISNELFPTEREENAECQFKSVPNDTTHPEKLSEADVTERYDALSDTEKFSAFMRFLAPPVRAIPSNASEQSVAEGEKIFERIGCAACHTPKMRTSKKAEPKALQDKDVYLYSDLALHDMGHGLQDGIIQGQAGEREFRTAPLWGLGHRAYFLHDGRANNLIDAIKTHASRHSAANGVIKLYNHLKDEERQSLLNFLRSL